MINLSNLHARRAFRKRGAAGSMVILNPAFMYAGVWLLVLFLYSLGLSDVLDPLETSTVVLVIGSSLSFIFGWVLESLSMRGRLAAPGPNLRVLQPAIGSYRVGRALKAVWIAFGLGLAFEIAYFGAAPAMGALGVGPEILYTDFGIPGFHGFLNALFYCGCTVQLARILLGSSRGAWTLTVISLAYPMLVMSRQVLISLLLQYLIIYLSLKVLSIKVIIRSGVLFGIVLLTFGYFGDIRSGREHIIALAAPTFDYPEWLPSAFIWVYIYLCTPLNNVNYNISIAPNYLPLETAGTLIPSFAREAFINALGGSRQWELVTESFNVSSLLQSLLIDFGVTGTIIFTLLCGIGFSRLMRNASNNPAAFFAVVVLLHGIALSFFANLLFHLVFVFEIIIIFWMMNQGRKS